MPMCTSIFVPQYSTPIAVKKHMQGQIAKSQNTGCGKTLAAGQCGSGVGAWEK